MPSAPSHEDTCPACKGPPKDAVTATCGHTFCRLCLVPPSEMGAQASCKVLLCPLCKEKGHTDPVTVPVPLGTLEEMHCEEHGEKVCFFCGHDAELLCTRCREGPSHHTHTVGFLHGAGQPSQSCRDFSSSLRGPSVMDTKNPTRSTSDFSEAPPESLTRPYPHNHHQIQALGASPRHWTALDVVPTSTLSISSHPPVLHEDSLRTQLEALRVEREETEDIKSQEDQKLQMLLAHMESKKQLVAAVFEKLQQELREQRGLLLARLSALEVQICKEREEYISKFSKEVARCGAEAKGLEKCQQPASVLLQDVRVSQSRCEKKTFVSPETISPALVEKIREVHRKILPLPGMLRTFSGTCTGRKPGASSGNRLRDQDSGPSGRQLEHGPLRGQEADEVHPEPAGPASLPRSSEGVPAVRPRGQSVLIECTNQPDAEVNGL
ncbi:tripartite motif-containing protein 15-like isoform X2 [Hyaena hyaena]|uniref:tripartite motif-containing protein 15-like isoform X2 n=1 Tax=Hyaena hyaena TaxID=95912 RepID=UPI0019234FC0|nr:tripartite motif-containing protein 15-like isoform X2 [Hyaena hyaena]